MHNKSTAGSVDSAFSEEREFSLCGSGKPITQAGISTIAPSESRYGVAGDCEDLEANVLKSHLRSRRRGLECLMYLFPFSVGLVVPFMGGMNGQLQSEIGGNVYFTVAIMYALAFLVTSVWTFFTTKSGLRQNWMALGSFLFSKPLHFVCLTGGLAGVGQHVLLTVVSATAGSGVYTLGNLLGSIATSIVLDVTGICWAQKNRVGLFAYVGCIAVAAGAVIHSLSGLLGSSQEASIGAQIGSIFLSMAGGFLLCFQSCVSNKLGEICGEFRRSVVWSFFSGAVVLLFIAPYTSPSCTLRTIVLPRNWWKISQTLLVIWCSVIVTIFQYKLNAGVVYCWIVVGQLLSSTLVDSLGWIGLDRRSLDLYNICGLIIVGLGIFFVTFDKLRQMRTSKIASALKFSASSITGENSLLITACKEPERHPSV
eukprot:Gregarina_sp_Poly_1__4434@NODE_2391_length_2192_cov_110_121882_g1520_i0_p1_GENE_NODE_2391_length_2192_cov_110_121882_g1520_i0NODE_2391_length_2192_cov_110_121882_g1520_i0_p1_ORF_typecomplete_len425_score37_66DMT_YdcZ/PF04657_13/1_8e12DMT_YdcZ/PF04657_13/4_1e16_NODE_2391_length_2192_cov_110_121882_g1520_i03441618